MPIVVAAGAVAVEVDEVEAAVTAHPRPAWMQRGMAAERLLEWSERGHRLGFAWPAPVRDDGATGHTDARLVTFRALLGDVASRLFRALAAELRVEPLVALVLR